MRVIGEFLRPPCKITIFAWNNRYLIKLENGLLEQTFKINQFDVSGEDDVLAILDDQFVQSCIKRFDDMATSLAEAMQRV